MPYIRTDGPRLTPSEGAERGAFPIFLPAEILLLDGDKHNRGCVCTVFIITTFKYEATNRVLNCRATSASLRSCHNGISLIRAASDYCCRMFLGVELAFQRVPNVTKVRLGNIFEALRAAYARACNSKICVRQRSGIRDMYKFILRSLISRAPLELEKGVRDRYSLSSISLSVSDSY